MKTLRKIRKNEKALSPVVASIILIAVTVAVSIAVAAWMGALTVGFMDTKSVTITNVAFANENEITVSVKNTGTSNVTITSAKVNGIVATIDPSTVGTGLPADIDITSAYLAGNAYKIELYDSNGQLVGAYQATAS